MRPFPFDTMHTWLLGVLALGCTDATTADSATPETGEAIDWSAGLEDDDQGAFLSVWGPSADDVWVVGGQPEQGVVLRGSAPSDLAAVALPDGVPLLNWVHGSAADDVWVAGLAGTLLHWNGAAWTDWSLPIDEAMWGVYAASATQAWAVGGESGFGGEVARAFRFDGSSWTAVTLPIDDLANLFKVHHDGEDLWMVGVDGTALRGDGTDMALVATGYAGDLVTANRPVDGGPLVVVGGRGAGAIFQADGDGLTKVSNAIAGLSGVQVYPGGQAVVVGESGYSGVWDTSAGTLTDVTAVTRDVLHATWGLPGGELWAVGGNLFTSDDTFHGVVLTAPGLE